MSPWRLTFELPPEVTVLAGWNAGLARDGRTVIAESPAWQPTLHPGDQISIGFVAVGPAVLPRTVILNDVECH